MREKSCSKIFLFLNWETCKYFEIIKTVSITKNSFTGKNCETQKNLINKLNVYLETNQTFTMGLFSKNS